MTSIEDLEADAGPFFVYDFPMPNNLMNDHPKLGFWPDGYYVSVNQFGSPPDYKSEGAGGFAFDRRCMLRGIPPPRLLI